MIGKFYKSGKIIATIEKPQITQADADGYDCDELRVTGGPTYTPTAAPVDPVATVTAALAVRERQASEAITALKARAAVALVMGGMSESAAYAAGSALVVAHSAQIQAFILAGGNPVAAQALLDAITASPPAWWNETMATLFAQGLGL